MILGESQIQGQVREAWEASRAQAGPVLHRLFQTALHVGSRVRTETGLGIGTASAASAGVPRPPKTFGAPSRPPPPRLPARVTGQPPAPPPPHPGGPTNPRSQP